MHSGWYGSKEGFGNKQEREGGLIVSDVCVSSYKRSAVIFVNSTYTRVTSEEVPLVELCPSDWFVGMTMGHFLAY